MNDILKIAAAAIATSLCCTVLRKQTPELALVLAITGGCLILFLAYRSLNYAVDFLFQLSEQAGLSRAVLTPVIKVIGIALISRIAGEFCRDAKESGVAAFLELAGTVTALVATIPLIRAVLSTVSDLI